MVANATREIHKLNGGVSIIDGALIQHPIDSSIPIKGTQERFSYRRADCTRQGKDQEEQANQCGTRKLYITQRDSKA